MIDTIIIMYFNPLNLNHKYTPHTFFCILWRILWASPQLSIGMPILSAVTLAASTYCFLSSSDIALHFSAALWFFSFNDGNAFPSIVPMICNLNICIYVCVYVCVCATCMLCVLSCINPLLPCKCTAICVLTYVCT